jgi:hypothetical protein
MDMRILAAFVLLVACRSEGERLCERAAGRLEDCQFGSADPETRQAMHNLAQNSIGGCTRNRLSVQMYRECLDRPTCDELDRCTKEFRDRMLPKVDPDARRPLQCEQHVRIQARREALGLVALTADFAAADCLGNDPDVEAADCLRAELRPLLAIRLTELAYHCARWSEADAACRMKLPTCGDF